MFGRQYVKVVDGKVQLRGIEEGVDGHARVANFHGMGDAPLEQLLTPEEWAEWVHDADEATERVFDALMILAGWSGKFFSTEPGQLHKEK